MLALLFGLTIAIYNKTFVDIVPVTLQADSAGNQLSKGADVKVRGILVGEVREIRSTTGGAELKLALQPVGHPAHPAERRGAADPEDAVRREVRRPASSPRSPASGGSPPAT